MPLAVKSQPKIVKLKRMDLYSTLPATVLDGDTVGVCNLSTVMVYAERKFPDAKEANMYYLLRYEVEQTYPYAIQIDATFRQLEANLKGMTTEKEKKTYLKEMDKVIKEQYRADMVGLSPEEGRILFKLINRESGTTSYDMVKTLRGSFSAFMWQSVARVFGNNMKDRYDPDTEDKEIENIVQLIQMGAI